MVIDELSAKLDEQHIHHTIDGRPKHFYSIYRKMVLQNKPFDQIYDLIAIRVLVDSVPDCYAVLGIVHTLWNQMPGRFKDYISVPKANMYQSLHTTVVGGRKMPFPFEVQIRTWEMHRIAEYGIAAHWRYKEGGGAANDLDSKLYWVRQILDWQSDSLDSREFLDTLKNRPLLRGSVPLHPQGRRHQYAQGRDAAGFRLPHSFRRGQQVRRQQNQRAHHAFGHAAGNGRPRGNHHQRIVERPRARLGAASAKPRPRRRRKLRRVPRKRSNREENN